MATVALYGDVDLATAPALKTILDKIKLDPLLICANLGVCCQLPTTTPNYSEHPTVPQGLRGS